jgi:hypothetical protein
VAAFRGLASFPRGLIPLGDAICRFNPVWGQGTSVAAQEAVLLRRLLGGGDPLACLAPRFFAEARELIETPWEQAAIPDFAGSGSAGDHLATQPLLSRLGLDRHQHRAGLDRDGLDHLSPQSRLRGCRRNSSSAVCARIGLGAYGLRCIGPPVRLPASAYMPPPPPPPSPPLSCTFSGE